jgi:hypothetical protein
MAGSQVGLVAKRLAAARVAVRRPWLIALLISCAAHSLLFLAVRVFSGPAADSGHEPAIASTAIVARLIDLHYRESNASEVPGEVSDTKAPEAAMSTQGSPNGVSNANEALATTKAQPSALPSALDNALPDAALIRTHYFMPDQLTSKPRLLVQGGSRDAMTLPDVFPLPVVVQLFINERGDVDKVVMGESFLSDIAKEFLMDSFTHSQFSPALIGEVAVKSQLTIEVRLESALSTQ